VAGFVGFDRGIRRLSFFASAGLALNPGPVLSADATVAAAQATGEPWILVADDARPRGWIPAARLAGHPGDTPLERLPADGVGHTFTAGTDSLRAALDAAVLSPSGLAVAIDGDGRVAGVATFDELRVAIQAADAADAAVIPGAGPAREAVTADNSKRPGARAEPAASRSSGTGTPGTGTPGTGTPGTGTAGTGTPGARP
jgi:osmoprotectant transport system ATP-binding protein